MYLEEETLCFFFYILCTEYNSDSITFALSQYNI